MSMGVAEHFAGLVAAGAQVSYAIGILLVLPLAAFATTTPILIAASIALMATTVVPQVLIPVISGLAAPERRGQIIGILQTGPDTRHPPLPHGVRCLGSVYQHLAFSLSSGGSIDGSAAVYHPMLAAAKWRKSFGERLFVTVALTAAVVALPGTELVDDAGFPNVRRVFRFLGHAGVSPCQPWSKSGASRRRSVWLIWSARGDPSASSWQTF